MYDFVTFVWYYSINRNLNKILNISGIFKTTKMTGLG